MNNLLSSINITYAYVFLEFYECSHYFEIRDNRDDFAFERITNDSSDASTCPKGDGYVFKIAKIIFYVGSMVVLEIGFLEANNMWLKS